MKKAAVRLLFSNEAHLRCMKNEVWLRHMKFDGITPEAKVRFASCERKRVLHSSEAAASCLRSKRLIQIQINLQSICKIPRTAKLCAGDIFYFPLSP